ncbi:indole-3-glycerol phosphate synthase TrpC [Desulfallas sp. Bu1-1]|jgi:indole-3-glycerol phosphate synthase|uniref:indole-3-glycerol phosphate synthase TrpC n=1 Tax=Desulfallas sp. Bu1-1 TaxID=2787620 RepID=UPI00189FEAA9|nr:indole-3-glycerol phosphate synthase TrpC [Desulfallas sp. Bu1-1]MBF7081841.1 indole-3-glycerol phosphate synthase TrpC [Desulfallas sp. Bu1-1]
MSIDFLETILRHKREEVADNKKKLPLKQIRERLEGATCTPGKFAAALRQPGRVALIAEVKRRSPSRGVIKEGFSLEETIAAYREAGADAVSVLTDGEFFGGSPGFLTAARKLTGQPLLRKDFIVDPYQVYESKLLGADAVLLIARILGDRLGEYIELAASLGLDALVETRSPEEINRALASGASIIGINNRDLRTFRVDLRTTVEMIKCIDDPGVTVVSESGIKTPQDVGMLGACGVHAVLVGETLMASGDVRACVKLLRGVEIDRVVAGA